MTEYKNKGVRIRMHRLQNNKKGFTIIEVVLVLAIAGLIFLMVFLALPTLQRNQRDTRRKSDLGRVQAQLESYRGAHRGNIPREGDATKDWNAFVREYLAVSGDEFIDPSGRASDQPADLKHYQFVAKGVSDTMPDKFEGEGGGQNKIYYTVGAKCDEGGKNVIGGQGSRVVAFRMKMEGAGYYCLGSQ